MQFGNNVENLMEVLNGPFEREVVETTLEGHGTVSVLAVSHPLIIGGLVPVAILLTDDLFGKVAPPSGLRNETEDEVETRRVVVERLDGGDAA